MAIKVYDPTQVGVIVGVSPMNGFAEDSMISIEMEDPQYVVSTDISGAPTRFKVNKSIAKVTIRLTQASPSNDLLSSYVEADRVNNAGVFPLMIKDNNGTSLFTSTAAFVEQVPSMEFANENKNREWVIKATNVNKFIGGVK
jgi:Protein of unknown function (DUF3277)